MPPKEETIIIKKIKKGGHGHHGGAWKVAYADFVTAMMAFFLLMWLLTATPVENLQGLADYFTPTMGLQGKMGIGFSGGQAPNSDGVSQGDWASQGLIFGAPPSGPIIKNPSKDNKINMDNPIINQIPVTNTYDEDRAFEEIENNLTVMLKSSDKLKEFDESVLIQITPEGLAVQVLDKKSRPMFKSGTATMLPHARFIIKSIAGVINGIPNYIQVSGHTVKELQPKILSEDSNWELSADRANAARKVLIKARMDKDQIARIVGRADHDPLDRVNPLSPENQRITITLLRKSLLSMHKRTAPDDIFLKPDQDGLEDYLRREKNKLRIRNLQKFKSKAEAVQPIVDTPTKNYNIPKNQGL
jgi:chemotaxis protein MotB